MNIDNHINKMGFPLIAHRGGLFYRPENTLAAFGYSLGTGVEWVECDVRLSKDMIPVLFHDDRLHIEGIGVKFVRNMSQEELAKFDVGGGEMIPGLEHLFEKYHSMLKFDVELKEVDAVQPSIDLIRKYELLERSLITSFIPDALQSAREYEPLIPRGLLVDRLTGNLVDIKSTVKAANLLGCTFLLPHYRLVSRDWTVKAHKAGLKLIPWTVNKMKDANNVINMGVDGIISDRPDYLRGIVNGRLDQ